jgi:hypothetical protein
MPPGFPPRGHTLDQFVGQTLVIPLSVVVLHLLRDNPAEMTVAERDHPCIHSCLMERTKRSAYALALRAWSGVCTTRIPASANRARTGELHFMSRSQISRHCYPSDRGSADTMAEVLQGAEDSRVGPGGILLGHSHPWSARMHWRTILTDHTGSPAVIDRVEEALRCASCMTPPARATTPDPRP